jgi:PAS domain S-box-containing protein
MAIQRPEPVNQEIILDPEKTILSKTDKKGIILYANDYFVEICGYSVGELMGKPHNIIRHPDMPKVVFELLWQRILNKKNIHAVVKNLAKDGRYYWVVTDFTVDANPATGNIVGLYAHRKAAPRHIIDQVEKVYKNLLEIEKSAGFAASLRFFVGYLEEKEMDYDQWIASLAMAAPKEVKKKGFFSKIFGGGNTDSEGGFFAKYFSNKDNA